MLKVICIDSSDTKSLVYNKIYVVKKIHIDNKISIFDDVNASYSTKRFRLLNGDSLDNFKNLGNKQYLYIDKRIIYTYKNNSYYICYKAYSNVNKGDIFKFNKISNRYWVTITNGIISKSLNINDVRKYFYMIDESDYISLERRRKIEKIMVS